MSWMRLAVISALLSCSEAWQTPSLSLPAVLELLPACRSPHRSPDWSNRPWTPRPSGPRCGPEIGQTPNDRAPRHEDEPIVTQGWWWMTMRSTACKTKMRPWRMEGQTDIHGCLDNVKTHNSAQVTMMDPWRPSTLKKQPLNFSTHACLCMRQHISNYLWKCIKKYSWSVILKIKHLKAF